MRWRRKSLGGPRARGAAARLVLLGGLMLTGGLILTVLACVAAAQAPISSARLARGDEALQAGAGEASPLRFRRVFVPADRMSAWPRGATRYVPIEASEFERLIKLAQEAGAVSDLGSAQLVSAHYEARLTDDDLLTGKFTWEVSHGAADAALLGLEPCNLPLHDARWDQGELAVLGNAADGRLGLLVEHAGRVQGTWSIRGQRSAAGSVSFGLNLPASMCIRLTCELPKGMTAATDHGVVIDSGGAAGGFRRWTIELGGRSRVRFRALAEGAASENRQLTLLSESLGYEFSKRGIDVAAQLRLDVHNEPLERVYLRLDPGLQLLAVRYGDVDVPWTPAPEPPAPRPATAKTPPRPAADKNAPEKNAAEKNAAEKSTAEKAAPDKPPAGKAPAAKPASKGTRVALDFPEPLLGTGHVLQLSAQARLPLGERLRLPGIQAEDVFWQSGTASLTIPRPLVLEHVDLHGARQVKTSTLPIPSGGESLELQYFGPDARLDVVVDQPDQRFQIDSGTIVDLSAAEMTGQSSARLQLTQGERFVVRADVGHHWLIDTVESDTDSIADWSLTTAGDKTRQLVMRLRHAVTPQRPVLLYLKGHRTTTLGEKISGGDLPMVRFPGQVGMQLLAVRAPDAYDLKMLNADELSRRDPARLSPQELAMFPEEPSGLVFAVDGSLARLSLGLAARKPSYAGEIVIDAAAHGKSLHETFTIRCTPQASRVERLLVNFSHSAKQNLHWALVGGNAGQLTARRLDDTHGPAQAASGESWEIVLRVPRAGPFEVRATRTLPLTNHLPLALASLPEAASQQGTLTIRALAETGLVILNRRLKPMPADLLPPDKYQTVRAAFRYEPSRDALAEPAVMLSPAASWQQTAGAWAWSSTLDSRYGLAGTANHVATYQVQTVGRQAVRCVLPPDATLRGVWVDERQVSLAALGQTKPGVKLDLPLGRSFVTLVVHFTTEDALPALIRTAQPPTPTLDVPELERHWLLWLPPGYELFDADPRWLVQPVQELTWSERLFGPLGRGARDRVFSPLAADSWRQLASPLQAGVARSTSSQRWQAAIAALGAEEHQATQRSALARRSTWGAAFGRWKGAEPTGLKLLVDLAALNRLGFDADTPLPTVTGSDELARGTSLLTQSNLMLIAAGDVMLISTAAAAARRRDQLVPAENSLAWAAAEGPLAAELLAAADGGSVQFVNLDAWLAGGATHRLPWALPSVARDDLAGTCGWNAAWLELPQGSPPAVRLVRTAGLKALGWAMCLVILAAGASWGARRAVPWVVAASLLAAAALVAPAVWTLVLAPSLLAVLVYLGLLATDRLSLLLWPAEAAVTPVRAGLQPRTLSLLAFAMVLAGHGLAAWAADGPAGAARDANRAAQDTSAAADAEPPLFTVFIPIDEQRQPTGGKYHIPDPMYVQLYRIAAAALNRPSGWLITDATYRGTLARDAVQRRLTITELTGVFDLRVFDSRVLVKIPLDRDALAAPGDAARLDGRAVTPEWDAATGSLAVAIAEPGQYRLEINLQPASQSITAHGGFDLTIPALARAAVELGLPMDAPAVDLPSARGAVAVSRDRMLVSGQLGPTSRLAVRWPDAAGADGGGTNLEVEELTWAAIRPGSLTVDARLRLHVLEGRVRQVRLLADGRLRLLPTAAADSLIAEIHSFPGEPQIIDVDLARPVADQVTLDLRFLLTGTSGVGNLRLPRLEVSGARATRRWMAVSIDPSLQYKELPGDARLLPAGDFAAAWPADMRPNAAYSVPRGELPLAVITEPREARTTVDQVLLVGVSQGQLAVRFEAALQTVSGANYELSLQGPANLQIDSATLFEDGAQRVTRWSQDGSGRITLFLNGPATGAQQLALTGTIPAAVTSRVPLPSLSLEGAETKKTLVSVYRSPSMLVELEDLRDLAPLAGDVSPALRPELGSAVAALGARGPAPGGMLKLRPNAPQTSGVLAVTVQRENDAWIADADLLLHVADGFVDTIRLDVPVQWGEPYQLDPPLAHEVFAIPGENRRQLLIRPAAPIKDHLRVRVRGRLGLAGGERLRVPDISAAWIGQLERFVVLPAQLELQQVEWETVGLRASELPDDFRKPLPAPETFTAYQVVGDHFQAALKSVERMAGAPQVRLADIQVAWRADGVCHGTAAFDIEPAGSTTCLLQVPGSLRLLQATVTGLPAILEPIGQDRWRVSLGSPELPQHIEVLFRGQLADGAWGSGHWRCEAPAIVGLEVERTLWTVYAPPQAGTGEPRSAQNRATAAQQELWRTKNVALMLNLASDAAADQLPEDIVRWYRPWQGRFERARTIIRADYLAAVAGRPAREENEAQALEQEQASVVRRLGALGGTKPRAAVGVCHQASELLPAEHLGERATLCTFRGGSVQQGPARLDLHYSEAWTGDLLSRLLAGLVLVAAGVASWRWADRAAGWTISPASAALAIGLIWWLACRPSGLGLVILVAGAIATGRQWWRARDVDGGPRQT